ncbi:hypothetical protein PCL_03961 [Purpureocillium lilacinum]|uniref:Uncharacterized protein n=1 Tax=Purpureocillium lilacinum TaxID=33203 RepID=A0A2U3EQI4_PURLI|nr:hypothetical protein PCL_03961 [Purpureocillium lilacinum]
MGPGPSLMDLTPPTPDSSQARGHENRLLLVACAGEKGQWLPESERGATRARGTCQSGSPVAVPISTIPSQLHAEQINELPRQTFMPCRLLRGGCRSSIRRVVCFFARPSMPQSASYRPSCSSLHGYRLAVAAWFIIPDTGIKPAHTPQPLAADAWTCLHLFARTGCARKSRPPGPGSPLWALCVAHDLTLQAHHHQHHPTPGAIILAPLRRRLVTGTSKGGFPTKKTRKLGTPCANDWLPSSNPGPEWGHQTCLEGVAWGTLATRSCRPTAVVGPARPSLDALGRDSGSGSLPVVPPTEPGGGARPSPEPWEVVMSLCLRRWDSLDPPLRRGWRSDPEAGAMGCHGVSSDSSRDDDNNNNTSISKKPAAASISMRPGVRAARRRHASTPALVLQRGSDGRDAHRSRSVTERARELIRAFAAYLYHRGLLAARLVKVSRPPGDAVDKGRWASDQAHCDESPRVAQRQILVRRVANARAAYNRKQDSPMQHACREVPRASSKASADDMHPPVASQCVQRVCPFEELEERSGHRRTFRLASLVACSVLARRLPHWPGLTTTAVQWLLRVIFGRCVGSIIPLTIAGELIRGNACVVECIKTAVRFKYPSDRVAETACQRYADAPSNGPKRTAAGRRRHG